MVSNVQRVEDRLDIQDVIYRWCRAIDRRDFAAIAPCFHPDAHDDHVFYRGDIPGLIECLKARHTTISFSMHAVSNVLIEFVDDDRALVESYVLVTQRRPLAAEDALQRGDGHDSQVSEVYCRYVDTIERRSGSSWKIARRILMIDSAREYTDKEPVHRLPAQESGNRGRRDGADRVYVEQAAVRAAAEHQSRING